MTFPSARFGALLAAARSTVIASAALTALTASVAAQTPPQGPAPSPQAVPAAIDQSGAVQESATQASPVAKLIEANLGNLKKIAPELIALVNANPALAAGIIEAAAKHPERAEALAQLLSKIQNGLKTADPDGAKIIAALVASAPPSFQAAYAVALAGGGSDALGGAGPGNGDGGGGGPAASTGGGTAGGSSGGSGGSGEGGGGGGGGSGGLRFGSAFGGSIGSGAGGGGGGGSTTGSSSSGGSEPVGPTFAPDVAGWLTGQGVDGDIYTAEELASWQASAQWLTDHSAAHGLNPTALDSEHLDVFYATALYLVLNEIDTTNATFNEVSGLLRMMDLTSGPMTPAQLTGFLSLSGVDLPRPLNQMTMAELVTVLGQAGYDTTLEELTQLLNDHDFDLSAFAGSCSGTVSVSTPCS